MGQSCLLSFIGGMWIILCHFCTSPNTKISATISRTLKNQIIYFFQQVLKLNISQACKMIPIIRRIHHQTKNHLGNACIFFFHLFFPLTEFFFFFLPIHTTLHLKKKQHAWCHILPSWLFHLFGSDFFCYSFRSFHSLIIEKTARMMTIFTRFSQLILEWEFNFNFIKYLKWLLWPSSIS